MVKVKKQPTRGDLSAKATKKKPPKNESEEYKLYQKWLRSKGFKSLRIKLLERDEYTCRCCGRTEEEIADNPKISLQAHHSTYRNVGKGNEDELKDLVCLCSVCHRSVHAAKSNLRRFTDKTPILENIKGNPNMECKVDEE